MKTITTSTALVLGIFLTSCDVQSGMTKKSLEKYNPSPTPTINVPTPEPVDPADIITADVNQTGPAISIFKPEPKQTANCDKYNRLTVNGDDRTITVTGVCRQLMINGDRNKVTGVAFAEIVLNGAENTVQYTKIANGKRPTVAENATPNTIEKVAEPAPAQKR